MPEFVTDLDKFLGALGLENGDIAWYFAQIPFESDQHVDEFISHMMGEK